MDLSPDICSQNDVRPNPMPPNFWSWFRAFEYKKEGAEESNQMETGGVGHTKGSPNVLQSLRKGLSQPQGLW